EPLGGVPELGEAVVEGAVLAPVHGLLPDEAGDVALQLGIGDLVSEVAHGADEELLAVGEHGGQRGGEGAEDQVSVDREVAGDVLQGLLEGDPAGGDLALGGGGGGHDGHGRGFEDFHQFLKSVTLVTCETPSRPPRRASGPARRSWPPPSSASGATGTGPRRWPTSPATPARAAPPPTRTSRARSRGPSPPRTRTPRRSYGPGATRR